MSAVDAPVAQPLGDVDGGLLGIDEIALRPLQLRHVLPDLVVTTDLHHGAFVVLRVVDHPDLLRGRRQVEREGLGDHGLARPRGAHQEKVPPLAGRDAGQADALVLSDDAGQGIGGDGHVGRGLHLVQREAVLRVQDALGGYGEHLTGPSGRRRCTP